MNFVKYHVCGSDYVITSDRDAEKNVIRVCNRQTGVGGYGVVIVSENPFGARFFRPNGKEIDLDVSALLCAAAYLRDRCGSCKLGILTRAGVMLCESSSRGEICVKLNMPCFEKTRTADVGTYADFAKTDFGTSRAVCVSNDIYRAVLFGLGEKLCSYGAFPHGADIDFVKIHSRDTLETKSYERGCGYLLSASGAAACAVYLKNHGFCDGKINILTDTGTMRVKIDDGLYLSARVTKTVCGYII